MPAHTGLNSPSKCGSFNNHGCEFGQGNLTQSFTSAQDMREKLKPFALKKKIKSKTWNILLQERRHFTTRHFRRRCRHFCAGHHPDLGSDTVWCAESSPSMSPEARSSAPLSQQLVSELDETRSKLSVLIPVRSQDTLEQGPSSSKPRVQVSIAIRGLIRRG